MFAILFCAHQPALPQNVFSRVKFHKICLRLYTSYNAVHLAIIMLLLQDDIDATAPEIRGKYSFLVYFSS